MVSRRSRLAMVVAWMLVVCGLGVSAHAQSQDGHISGTVRDSTGATVPGVSVTATNQAGGATKSAVTAADGTYTINVPAGTYTLSAALRGFGRQSVKDIAVAAGGTASADFSLAARAEDEVTVTAMLREGTVQDTPFSVAAPTEEVMHARGIDSLEARGSERRRLHGAEPRPGTEHRCDARRFGRPDRPRPAGREGAGRLVPR